MKKRYQVAVKWEANGYVTVEADSAAQAEHIVRRASVLMDYDGAGLDVDMMPETPDCTVESVVECDNEDEE